MTMTSTTMTIGLDLGDRKSQFCVLDPQTEVVGWGRCATTRRGIRKKFERRPEATVVVEVGTHSPWVSKLLEELGHAVIVANPRRVKLISENQSKAATPWGAAPASLARAP